ncbi:hypothetical protein [Liquorilactobacillus cacaonum]
MVRAIGEIRTKGLEIFDQAREQKIFKKIIYKAQIKN